MKIKVPAKEVEACDICSRTSSTGLLTKCVVCGKEYCCVCEAIMPGCVHQPDICRQCGSLPKVRAFIERYAPLIGDVLKKRNASLRCLKLK